MRLPLAGEIARASHHRRPLKNDKTSKNNKSPAHQLLVSLRSNCQDSGSKLFGGLFDKIHTQSTEGREKSHLCMLIKEDRWPCDYSTICRSRLNELISNLILSCLQELMGHLWTNNCHSSLGNRRWEQGERLHFPHCTRHCTAWEGACQSLQDIVFYIVSGKLKWVRSCTS